MYVPARRVRSPLFLAVVLASSRELLEQRATDTRRCPNQRRANFRYRPAGGNQRRARSAEPSMTESWISRAPCTICSRRSASHASPRPCAARRAATLTGKVDAWGARAATEDAFLGGANDVYNRLDVQ